MTRSPPRPAPPAAQILAGHVAGLLPARAGAPWTVEPYAPWWTARYPGARPTFAEEASR